MGVHDRPRGIYLFDRVEGELCWLDPKDGELCVVRLKPVEMLVEGRRRPDVQIGAQNCV